MTDLTDPTPRRTRIILEDGTDLNAFINEFRQALSAYDETGTRAMSATTANRGTIEVTVHVTGIRWERFVPLPEARELLLAADPDAATRHDGPLA